MRTMVSTPLESGEEEDGLGEKEDEEEDEQVEQYGTGSSRRVEAEYCWSALPSWKTKGTGRPSLLRRGRRRRRKLRRGCERGRMKT